MAASGAKHSAGTTLSVGGSITEVLSIGAPDNRRETIDVTHLGSDNTAREKIAGLIDAGQATAELNFIKTVASTLLGYMDSGTAQSCSIVLSGSLGTLSFNAIVSGVKVIVEVGKPVTVSLTLDVTGKTTLT
jgi:predicted secreted protein